MLEVGAVVPSFELPNQDGEMINIEAFRGQQVILFAFPMASTPDCTKQACIYRDTYDSFTEHNSVVLGITSSPASVLKKWREHHNFPYDLLSDTKGTTLEKLGAWSQYIFQGVEDNYARRSYWIIDEQGIVQDVQIGVDAENSVQQSLDFVIQRANAVAE